jgi:hypothetical protein
MSGKARWASGLRTPRSRYRDPGSARARDDSECTLRIFGNHLHHDGLGEVLGRLAPGADLEAARAELRAVCAAMLAPYPEAYPKTLISASMRACCAIRLPRARE